MKTNLCKSAGECAKQFSLIDFGLLELCSCSFGLIAGMLVPKKSKKQVIAASSTVFAFALIPLLFKFIRTISNQENSL